MHKWKHRFVWSHNNSAFLHFSCISADRNDYIYWTDARYDRIYRSNTNGSNVMIIVNTGLSCAGLFMVVIGRYEVIIIIIIDHLFYRGFGLGLGE